MNSIADTKFIFLDDVRLPPSKEWTVVRDAYLAYSTIRDYVRDGESIVVSLDHDLGDNTPTGYDLLNWLERDIYTESGFRPNIAFCIHSANPVGRANMERAIRAIERLLL